MPVLLRLAAFFCGTDALEKTGALRQHTPTGLPFSKFPARAETPLENLDGGPCSASAVSAAGSASAAQHFIRRRRRFGGAATRSAVAGPAVQTVRRPMTGSCGRKQFVLKNWLGWAKEQRVSVPKGGLGASAPGFLKRAGGRAFKSSGRACPKQKLRALLTLKQQKIPAIRAV